MLGILPIHKPAGITSHDVVNTVKFALNPKGTPKSERIKVGHAGTLDPFATGVLLVMIGKATRLEQFLHAHSKTYEATIQLGSSTTTDDTEGEILETQPVPELPNRTTLEVQLRNTFTGTLQQLPPTYAAIKQNGKKQYELAREGKAVHKNPREVEIHAIEVLECRAETNEIEIRVEVGTGTYVRALGRDIGEFLNTKAHLTRLVRTRIGPVVLESCIDPEIRSLEHIAQHLLPVSGPLLGMQEVSLSTEQRIAFEQGQPVENLHVEPGHYALALDQAQPIAIIETREHQTWPKIVLT
ncbi:MAG: tRNA pseudouridine(55) synthase TruB [Candidatus Andersenbacteria bacterium]|nr:tRNA pseudouridine(55) synthase TruB [Candidatus Andersenbacteria bacterium]